MAPTIPYFRGIKRCIQYLAIHSYKISFILLTLIMDQILSELHGVGLNFKTTQPKIVYNVMKARIIIEILNRRRPVS